MTDHRDQLLASIKHLRMSGDHSDFTFTCGPDVHAVHKAIVCARSGNFARAERFEDTEANTGNINFLPEEDDPKLIKLMLQYMYEATYDSGANNPRTRTRSPSSRPRTDAYGHAYSYKFPHNCQHSFDENIGCLGPFLCPHHFCYERTCNYSCVGFECEKCTLSMEQHMGLHAGMAMIADKYDVYGLQDLAKSNFKNDCQVHWNTLEFAEAAKYVCGTPVEGLKEVVIDTIVAHKELLKREEIKELLKRSDGLAYEILRRISD